MDISETEEPSSKKSPSKVARRDEPIFAPRSLFDRPSPALAKLRRDYRLQKYSVRPPVPAAVKTVLGPGSVTFPIIPSPSAKPPPPPPADMAEWMVAEDSALLTVIYFYLAILWVLTKHMDVIFGFYFRPFKDFWNFLCPCWL